MNVNSLITVDYENISDWTLGENKPNSNPIKPNLQNAQMNVNLYFIEDYRKKADFSVRKNKPNSNPISEKAKMNVNIFATKDYKNETTLRPQKNKPKQSQFQTAYLLIDSMKPKLFPRISGLRRTKAPPYRLLRSEFCFGESHIFFLNCINRHLAQGRALVWPIFFSHLQMLLDRLFLLFLYILCKGFSIAVHVFHNNFFYIPAAVAKTVLHPGPSMLLLYFYL